VNAAVYLEASIAAGADRLIGARTDAAAEVQLHTHVQRDGVAQMQRVEALEITVDRPAVLAPGGDHLMLIDLERPLAGGESIELMLLFERAGEVPLTVPVIDPRGRAQHEHR
jgi:copper(I)-binding protein